MADIQQLPNVDFNSSEFFKKILAELSDTRANTSNINIYYDSVFGTNGLLFNKLSRSIPVNSITLLEQPLQSKLMRQAVILINTNKHLIQKTLNELLTAKVLLDFIDNTEQQECLLDQSLTMISPLIDTCLNKFSLSRAQDLQYVANQCKQIFYQLIENQIKNTLFSLQDSQGNTFLNHLIMNTPILTLGFYRIFTRLIQLGFDFEIPNNNNQNALFLLETKFPHNFSNLKTIITHSPRFIPKTLFRGGTKGLVTMMGALGSPATKVSSIINYGNCFTPRTPKYYNKPRKEMFGMRPVQTLTPSGHNAITPDNSILAQVWSIKLQEHTTEATLTIFAEPTKLSSPNAVADPTLKEATPKKLATKHIIEETLTAELTSAIIKQWHGKSRGEQQNTVMGASANDAALAACMPVSADESWQWCHLIAHSMGGPTNIIMQTPQIPENLVLGTTEANAQMAIIEKIVTKIVTSKLNLIIQAKASYVEDKEKYSLAKTVTYTITDSINKRIVTIEFNMLSRRKIFEQEIDILYKEIFDFFTTGLQPSQEQQKMTTTHTKHNKSLFERLNNNDDDNSEDEYDRDIANDNSEIDILSHNDSLPASSPPQPAESPDCVSSIINDSPVICFSKTNNYFNENTNDYAKSDEKKSEQDALSILDKPKRHRRNFD